MTRCLCVLICFGFAFHFVKAQEPHQKANEIAYQQLNINLDTSAYYAKKALKISTSNSNLRGMSLAHIHLGFVDRKRAKLPSCIYHFETADSLALLAKDKKLEAWSKMEIGRSLIEYAPYTNQQTTMYYQRAYDKLDFAEQLYSQINDTSGLIKVCVKKSKLSAKRKNIEQSNFHLRKAYKLSQSIKNRLFISITSLNLASNQYQLSNYDSILYWTSIASQNIDSGNTELRVNIAINRGMGFFMLEQDDSVPKYYQEARRLLKITDFPKLKKALYDNYAQYYTITGEYELATNYFDSSLTITESINSDEKLKIAGYALEAYHTKDLELKKNKAEKKTQLWIIFSISALIIGGIVGLWLNQKRKNIRQTLTMEKQKFSQQIEQQENKNLQAILDALEDERTRIAQDIHDRIGAGISTAKLYFEGMKELVSDGNSQIEENFNRVDSLLATSIEEVRKVSHNMVSGVLADFGLVPALQDLKETIENSRKLSFELDQNLKERLDKNIEINLYRVVQEMVTNSIKYSECSTILVSISVNNDSVFLIYKDDGIGFIPEEMETGMGLKNISARVQAIRGEIMNKSKPEDGAHYNITIPFL